MGPKWFLALVLFIVFGGVQVSAAGKLCSKVFEQPTHKEIKTQLTEIFSKMRKSQYENLSKSSEPVQIKIYENTGYPTIEQNFSIYANNSGLEIYQNDIYINMYYFKFFGAHYVKNRPRISEFARNEIWLKWHPETRHYTLEKTACAESLIEKMSGKNQEITLYRGTFESEVHWLKEISKGDSEVALNEIKKNLHQPGAHRGYFFTPNEKAAQGWAKGAVVHVTLSKEEMLQWAREGKIYVGIEGHYVEVAFTDPQVMLDLALKYQSYPYQK